MKMKKKSVNYLVEAGLIAAIYAAATYAAAAMGLAYSGVQFRISEALTVLAAFTPAAIPGLTIGCFLGNLTSPYGMIDVICGTAATLVAACFSRMLRKVTIKGIPVLSAIPPIIANAVIVGFEVAVFLPEGFSWMGFGACALSVGLGEAAVCLILGIPLMMVLKKADVQKVLFKNSNI